MGDVQVNNIRVTTRLEGFDDPLVGLVSFEQFDDPLVGLETLRREGKVSARRGYVVDDNILAVDIPQKYLEVQYREPNEILRAFRESRPVDVHTRKVGEEYEMTFVPR